MLSFIKTGVTMQLLAINKNNKALLLCLLLASQCFIGKMATAACNNLTPNTNDVVNCSGANPNTQVYAVAGSTNVNITTQQNSSLSMTISPSHFGVLIVESNSRIENNGTLQLTAQD